MITVLIAGILGFLISLTALPVFIKKMKSLKLGQLIRDEGPVAHQYKAGTPTMAGLIFIPAAILAYLLTMGISAVFFGTSPLPSATAWLTIAFTLGMLGVGAADDIMKFRHKGNEGLTERQKTIGLLAVTVPFAFLAFQFPNESGARPHPPRFPLCATCRLTSLPPVRCLGPSWWPCGLPSSPCRVRTP